jgi:hypothetical protein
MDISTLGDFAFSLVSARVVDCSIQVKSSLDKGVKLRANQELSTQLVVPTQEAEPIIAVFRFDSNAFLPDRAEPAITLGMAFHAIFAYRGSPADVTQALQNPYLQYTVMSQANPLASNAWSQVLRLAGLNTDQQLGLGIVIRREDVESEALAVSPPLPAASE